MAARRRKTRKTPKSKWSRSVNRRPKRKPRFKLSKRQMAKFAHLMAGGSLDESE